MSINVDDILKEEILQACAKRKDQVLNLEVFQTVIEKLIRDVRDSENGGEVDHGKLEGFIKQLEKQVVQSQAGEQ